MWKGEAETATLGVASDARITIPRGAYPRLQASMNVTKPLLAPLAKGAVVGNLAVALDGKPLIEVPLVALADYPEGGFFKRLGDAAWLWWSSD